ncbi:MAG: hypothetical protein ACOZAO_05035 [Patescibacteria group bacterium]
MNVVYWQMGALVVVISAVIGLIAKYALDKSESDLEITWTEYAIAVVLISVALGPFAVWRGSEIARNNLKSFNENINAVVTGVSISQKTCERDGDCVHTYDCDRYRCSYSCDSDNDGDSDDTCYKWCYHSCPYCSVEYQLLIHTNTDGWSGRNPVIASNIIPPDADQNYRWRQSEAIPQGIQDAYGRYPQQFLDAFYNLQNGTEALPFVYRRQYNSYTLAANVDSPEEWQDEITLLQQHKPNLMPTLQTTVTGSNQAHRVYFVGFTPTPAQAQEWTTTLSYINSPFGNDRQGDLHVVIINKQGVDMSLTDALTAIKYDWQNSAKYGDDTMAKNAVLVGLETDDGATVFRAAMVTGMPEELFDLQYNDDLRAAIANDLTNKGLPLDPQVLFGRATMPFTPQTEECTIFSCFRGVGPAQLSGGVLTERLFGVTNPELAFQRISMSAKDPEDVGPGFVALDELIIPTPKQQTWIVILSTVFACLAWVATALIGQRYRPFYNRYSRFGRY